MLDHRYLRGFMENSLLILKSNGGHEDVTRVKSDVLHINITHDGMLCVPLLPDMFVDANKRKLEAFIYGRTRISEFYWFMMTGNVNVGTKDHQSSNRNNPGMNTKH